MKIDIHTHTRKIKQGDPPTRDVTTARFAEVIKSTDVKILAITNHNHFDLKQYKELRDSVDGTCQIWPGIELDILESGKRAHLLVICDPENCDRFAEVVSQVLGTMSPDDFTVGIEQVVKSFDSLDCIYVAHYIGKKPNLEDAELELLSNAVSNPKRILKEAANSISAGIYISHGHNSIHGSDIQDWEKYEAESVSLPELRLPVESFSQFCLLLEKDEATINTILDKKIKESIEIFPFSPKEKVSLEVYNDINILFGSKGTGKTDILDALSKYFNNKGFKTDVFKTNESHLNDVFDIKGNQYDCNARDFGVDECVEEISFLRSATDAEITSISKYKLHFDREETNKISQKIKIKDIQLQDTTVASRELDKVHSLNVNFGHLIGFLYGDDNVKEVVGEVLLDELHDLLEKISIKFSSEIHQRFDNLKSTTFLNHIRSVVATEISRKTGVPPKPVTTGFKDYCSKRIEIEVASRKIISNFNKTIEPIREYVGSLGEKGDLYCETQLQLQNGNFTNSGFTPVKGIKKTPISKFCKAIQEISNAIYSDLLFGQIAKFNEIEDIELIDSMSCLLLKSKKFTLNGNTYSPSNGESAMILLHRELNEDREIYLIDEPEKSLGNDYINDVVVPILKDKALLGKRVIIATHDANIAVRTLPYKSIYRKHENGEYFTLTGNPFSNLLKCVDGKADDMDWKEISMRTLEGGKQAFGERGKIYGN